MFFMMGISQGQKQLDFDQLIVCGHCGKYGHLNVYMVYTYLSLFFIPVFKWGRRYYVQAGCCGTSVELDAETGRKIASGELKHLPEDIIPAGGGFGTTGGNREHRCPNCGFTTEEDYSFCPKCGGHLE